MSKYKVINFYKRIRHAILSFVFFVFKPLFFTKKNIFVFNNFFGLDYADNPAFIADAIHKMNKDIKLYWICKSPNIELPSYIRPVLMKSLKEKYVLMRAKVRVSNIRNYFPLKLKSNQIYIQTWHGSNGLKLVEGAIEDKLSPKYVEFAKYDGSICDAILSCSKEADERYLKYFYLGSKCEILKYGFPRRDYIINNKNNNDLKDSLRFNNGIDKNDFVIVYAPTFRDDGDMSVLYFDFNKMLQSFEDKLGKKCKLIIRLHPSIVTKNNDTIYNERILNGNLFKSLNDLILIGDLLITDYSSTYYEFALVGTPIILYCPDFEKYNETRGSTQLINALPFLKVMNEGDLIRAAKSFDYSLNKKIVMEFLASISIYDDGNASVNVAKWILTKAGIKVKI